MGVQSNDSVRSGMDHPDSLKMGRGHVTSVQMRIIQKKRKKQKKVNGKHRQGRRDGEEGFSEINAYGSIYKDWIFQVNGVGPNGGVFDWVPLPSVM